MLALWWNSSRKRRQLNVGQLNCSEGHPVQTIGLAIERTETITVQVVRSTNRVNKHIFRYYSAATIDLCDFIAFINFVFLHNIRSRHTGIRARTLNGTIRFRDRVIYYSYGFRPLRLASSLRSVKWPDWNKNDMNACRTVDASGP